MRIRCLVLLFLSLAACKRTEPAEPVPRIKVRCEVATEGPWTDRVDVRGLVTATPDKHAMVSAEIAGRITKLLVQEGDRLAAGTVIAELERAPQADVLVQSEAAVRQADVSVRNAELARLRAEHLYETGVGSKQQLDDETARYQTAVSTATAARAGAAVSRRGVTRTSIVSPIAGVMVHLLRHNGELVDGTSATPVAEVADPDALELVASSGAADIVRLERGQKVGVTFTILGDAGAEGQVRAVAPAVDPITGLGTVRVALAPRSLRLPIGVFGEASVIVGTRDKVVSLPGSAVRTGPAGKPEAVVCAGDKAETRALRIGSRTPDRVEVVDGVKAGEHFVSDAVLGIEDGTLLGVNP